MKKIIWSALGVVAVLGLAFWGINKETSSAEQVPSQKEVVKIGVIMPLTGNSVVYGEAFKNMFQMRFDEITKNSNFDYKIIFEDDQFDIKKQILAAQKLINLDNVDVIFTSAAGGEGVVADLMRGKNKLLFSSLWDV